MAKKRRSKDELKEIDALVERLRDFVRLNYVTAAEIGRQIGVGPFHTDSAEYVFGDERPSPNVNHGAGIDVSAAVRDFLGLRSLELVDWRFVEQADASW
jgi:hypothetical protein